jgi:hypothetical protein
MSGEPMRLGDYYALNGAPRPRRPDAEGTVVLVRRYVSREACEESRASDLERRGWHAERAIADLRQRIAQPDPTTSVASLDERSQRSRR